MFTAGLSSFGFGGTNAHVTCKTGDVATASIKKAHTASSNVVAGNVGEVGC